MNKIPRSLFVIFVMTGLMAFGCGGSAVTVNNEAPTAAIRAAEEVGAANVPEATLYLQLAKEGLQQGMAFAASGNKEEAESKLNRAQADAELAIALSHKASDKKDAEEALEKVKKLRSENQKSMGGN